jgi:hypothetical protein
VDFTAGVGVSGKQWFCDSERIFEVTSRPHEAQLYKTYSVYYIGGVGFSILSGDARKAPDDDDWHPLQFAYYNEEDYSSYLTNAGQAQTLRLQPQDRNWANLLLPTTNHTHTPSTHVNYGGVVGELPIFLALLAFTTSREYLPNVLPRLFIDGAWVTSHSWQMSSTSKASHLVRRVRMLNSSRNSPTRCGSHCVHLPKVVQPEWVEAMGRFIHERPIRLRNGKLG